MRVYLVIFLLLFSGPAFSDNAKGISNKRLNEYFKSDLDYEAFFLNLKSSLLSGDKQQVASLNLYPIRVNYPSGSVYYDTREQFIENYDSIVTPEMLTRVKEQQFKNLFYNYNGLNIGFGDIWFSGICMDGGLCTEHKINVWAYSVLSISKK